MHEGWKSFAKSSDAFQTDELSEKLKDITGLSAVVILSPVSFYEYSNQKQPELGGLAIHADFKMIGLCCLNF